MPITQNPKVASSFGISFRGEMLFISCSVSATSNENAYLCANESLVAYDCTCKLCERMHHYSPEQRNLQIRETCCAAYGGAAWLVKSLHSRKTQVLAQVWVAEQQGPAGAVNLPATKHVGHIFL